MKIYDPSKTHFRTLLKRHKGSDEFFTRREDIENELAHYPIEQWQGKRVLCSCDSPTSAFVQYFHDNYHRLGLQHLTATCVEGTRYDYDGKTETITQLGSGDVFGSEVGAILRDSDVVCTNPPFSEKIPFLELLLDWKGKFIFVGPLVAISCLSFINAWRAGKYRISGSLQHFNDEAGNLRKTIVACRWYSNMVRDTTPRPLPCNPYDKDTAQWAEQEWEGEPLLIVDRVRDIPKYEGPIGAPIGVVTDGYDVSNIDVRGILRAVVDGKARFVRVIFKWRKG